MKYAPKMLALLLVTSTTLAGCGKKEVETLPPVAEGTDYGNGQTDPNGIKDYIVPGSQEDFAMQMGVGGDRIFFDTDRFNIDAQDQATLQKHAQFLSFHSKQRVTIEGHADERGTREYNLALGERRANAAKNYLVSLGIDASRISTVSYGKDRPQALGSDESAWAQNRRAVTVILQ